MGRKSIAEQRRAEIIEAFHSCAVRDGLHGASIRKIASEAGMTPGIIHHYFKDRDEMVEVLVIGSAEEHISTFMARLTGKETPRELLEKAVDFIFSPNLFNNDSGSLFYDFWSESKRNENVRKSISRVYVRFRDIIIKFLDEAGLTAELPEDEKTPLATLIIAMYEGAFLQWDMDRNNFDMEKMKEMVKEVILARLMNVGARN